MSRCIRTLKNWTACFVQHHRHPVSFVFLFSKSRTFLFVESTSSSDIMRFLSSPTLLQISSIFVGSTLTVSRLILFAKRHPLPDVVIPNWKSPFWYVDNKVNVHFSGTSATFMGIRFLMHVWYSWESNWLEKEIDLGTVTKIPSGKPSTSERPYF